MYMHIKIYEKIKSKYDNGSTMLLKEYAKCLNRLYDITWFGAVCAY